MSGVIPTAPEQPADEKDNQIKSPDQRPDAPPDYNSHFVPGPPGPAVPALAGYAGGLPMGYNSPQQPGTFFSYQPAGGAHPIQYQPGKYHMSNQPVSVTWMPGPPPIPNCPPGLEYLTQLDTIHVLQHFEPLEMITSFETNNGYDIKNNLDQMVYIVNEDTDDFTRNAYRTLRPFVLRVTDCMGREIMTMQRPFRCTCCCFCCPSTRQESRKLPCYFVMDCARRHEAPRAETENLITAQEAVPASGAACWYRPLAPKFSGVNSEERAGVHTAEKH
uniref:phospholipid scramblase 4 isoform X2 n=1 Tax=Panthera onca TaxID=9690 RepID=UPI002954E21D|nr:phospholipid scramblase 4 isoform X2 [Panthera onca]